MKKRLIGVLLVLALASVLCQVAALGAPSIQPSATVIGTLPPAYVGTDYTIDVRVLGLASPRLILKQPAAPQAEFEAPVAAANQMALSTTGETVASAYIPGSAFKAAGTASFSIRGLSSAGTALEFGPYSIEVLNPPASAALGDSQLGLMGAQTTYTRWFYDVERAGNMLNGVNISGIASLIKSPIRDASGVTEQWPSINFSHNLPEAGTSSGAVQPHRGFDIARTNTNKVWAVIGATVTYADAASMIVTTAVDLDSNGSTDMYVQYEHIIPASGMSSGVTVQQSTVIGTVGELNHVHVRFDNPSRFSMPQSLFWLDSTWASAPTGLDADFIRTPSAIGTSISVKIHGWNVGAHQYGNRTRIYHRKLGGSSYFRFMDMTKQSDGITWTADISAYYSPGDVIEYYIESTRHDLTGTLDSTKTVYRPTYYKMDWDGTKWVGLNPVEYFRTTK